MATIEPYEIKGGKRYRVRYRTPDHRQTDKRGFHTKRVPVCSSSRPGVRMGGEGGGGKPLLSPFVRVIVRRDS